MLLENPEEHGFTQGFCFLFYQVGLLSVALFQDIGAESADVVLEKALKPFMFEEVVGRGPIFHILLEAVVDELLAYFAHLNIVVELVSAKCDSVGDALDAVPVGLGGEVGRPVVEHHVGQNPQRPDIAFVIVFFVFEDFGSHGERRSAEAFEIA